MRRSRVYLVVGPNPDDPPRPLAYIGEGDNVLMQPPRRSWSHAIPMPTWAAPARRAMPTTSVQRWALPTTGTKTASPMRAATNPRNVIDPVTSCT